MEIHLFPGNCIEIGMPDRYLRVLINFSIYPVVYGLTLSCIYGSLKVHVSLKRPILYGQNLVVPFIFPAD